MPESGAKYSVLVANITNPGLVEIWPETAERVQIQVGSPESGFRIILYLAPEVTRRICALLCDHGFCYRELATRQ